MKVFLDLSAFEKAILQFSEALQAVEKDVCNTIYRDACLHRFDIVYALSCKLLKRYLKLSSPNPNNFDEMIFADLIRVGNEQGVLRSDWPHWETFRKARELSTQGYEDDKASKAMEIIPDFLAEAKALLQEFKK
jgi:nucleotidyltransferase substrate binding protein (TIGR01987 family)